MKTFRRASSVFGTRVSHQRARFAPLKNTLLALWLFAGSASAETLYILKSDGSLATTTTANPAAVSAGVPITGIDAGETAVAIDVRPQNQRLYMLGVNAAANTATLYHLSPETGYAGAVGPVGSIALTTDGATPVDLPDPTTQTWDIDFNPTVDRLRVVAGSLNFRVDPNTGRPVDGNNGGGAVSGNNPDGSIHGATSTVAAAAYTDNSPNRIATTLYTLDEINHQLLIQNPANGGDQTSVAAITIGGNPLNFLCRGFDIAPGVNAPAAGLPVNSGSGFALLSAGGVTGLYSINLTNGAATVIGGDMNVVSFAIRTELGAAIALNFSATQLLRFDVSTPGTVVPQAIAPLGGSEVLVGIDMRPQTGQLMGLGVNAATDTATLYIIDPQTGAVTAVGTTGVVALFDGAGNPIDLPDPAVAGYGVNFNPSVDRLRVVTSTGKNFRVNPNNGSAIDGNFGGAVTSNTNPDGDINGNGSTGVSATAYTNSFGRDLGVTGPTTQYTLDAANNTLFIQNPPNSGNQTQPLPVTLGGSVLDFTESVGFDIPASVSVPAGNFPAVGTTWFVASVGGTTSLYQINLETGVATNLGQIGTGLTAVRSLVVNATPSIVVESPTNVVMTDNVDTIDFGTSIVDTESTKTITIKNFGSHTLTYATTIDDGAAFSVLSGASGSVAVGQSASLTIKYHPPLAGIANDTLRILNNDAATAFFDIALTGESYIPLSDDSAITTVGTTRVYVLANDGVNGSVGIDSVSEPSIQIDGRSLIIPAGYSGTFTYFTSHGGRATVTVAAKPAVVDPKMFNGLLRNSGNGVVGFAKATFSAANVATIQLIGDTVKVNAKATFSTGSTTASVATSLGYLTLTKNLDGTVSLDLIALGGNVSGTLQPLTSTAAPAKHHIAIRSLHSNFSGGAFATATISKKAGVAIVGILPDGVPFKAAAGLQDNGSFVFYSLATKAKPAASIAGDFTVATLPGTDVTGGLSWYKLPQLPTVKGLHLGGADILLEASGCISDGTVPLPDGPGTLLLDGGNLAVSELLAATVSAGIPTVATSTLKSWTANAKKGTFAVKVFVPGITKPVAGKGLYLPKSGSAWGFFPGTTEGGRIELVVP